MATHPPTTPTRSTNGDARGPLSHPLTTAPSPAVNRKKQKRRQKQAARLATEPSDELHAARDTANSAADDRRSFHDNAEIEADSADLSHPGATVMHKNGLSSGGGSHEFGGPAMTHDPDGLLHAASQKAKKKKNKKGRSDSHTLADGSSTPLSTPSATFSHPPPPPSLPYASQFHAKSAREGSIWNQSSLEERENIRTFWFELGEEERRQLVKVEKDAVLKKMKEQQKHSCSCTVCGRKRTAIEEELEVLYDAYYEELEQYANNNQGSFDEGAPIIPPPRLYQPPLRSPGQHTRTHGQFHPSRGRVQELPEDDEEDLEDDYDDEEEDDEEDEEEDDELYSEEEFEDEEARAARADFFAFGNSLTVKDGILTVADDLLKNDGKHFIDMMEQLAERRMQREEDTQYNIAAAHQSFHAGHNHGPLDDEDYDDEEDEDYDSQEEEEEEFDEDEMDAMTEEQRMQEGRRMFQIFAARMFEQRVMTAYREKVAEQRQKQLIEELLEEENRNEQRNAKKAREAQKKKDKKRLQKQAKEEEKARRDAEKAAEEAAVKAAQEKKLEEQRLKREEQRKRREAERKAQEEERARKEAEKHRRLQEERERHAEAERKQREQKEEKKRREEAKRKEKEERDAQEKKTKEEQERRTREEQAKKDRQSAPTVDQEPKERGKHETPARAGPPGPIPLPSLQSQFSSGSLQSPHHAVATPVAPKVSTTPGRPRQASHQSSHTSSPHSQTAPSDFSLQPSISPRSFGQSHVGASAIGGGRPGHQQPPLHHPQPSAPLSPLGRSNPPGFPSLGGLSSGPPGLPGMGGRPLHPELPMYSPNSGIMSPFRGLNGPAGIPAPPGINGVRPMGPGRGFPTEPAPGLPFATHHGVSGAFPMQQPGLSKTHSKQPSGSFPRSPLESGSQPFPISRPSPIKRPPSAAQDHHEVGHVSSHREVDDLSTQLGSSALLDDADGPYPSKLSQSLPGANAPGQFPPPSRASFQGSSLFTEPLGSKPGNFTAGSYGWGAPFGSSTLPGASSTWGATTANGSGWPNAFTAGSHHRGHTSRPVTIRLLVIQACKQLNSLSPRLGTGGYHEVNMVLGQVQQLRSSSEPAISLDEMLEICDTEGNHQNGGGSFFIKEDGNGRYVKFEPDTNSATTGHRGSIVPGDIGSPIPGSSHPATFGAFGAPSVLRQYASPPAGLYGGTS